MPDQYSNQPALFEMTEPAGTAEMASAPSEKPAQFSGPELTSSSAARSGIQAGPFQAVSPFANLPLHEACAFCGAEVRAPGFVILDFEELGVFCNEECGDKRFRLYLNDTADEDSELDDEKPND